MSAFTGTSGNIRNRQAGLKVSEVVEQEINRSYIVSYRKNLNKLDFKYYDDLFQAFSKLPQVHQHFHITLSLSPRGLK